NPFRNSFGVFVLELRLRRHWNRAVNTRTTLLDFVGQVRLQVCLAFVLGSDFVVSGAYDPGFQAVASRAGVGGEHGLDISPFSGRYNRQHSLGRSYRSGSALRWWLRCISTTNGADQAVLLG